MGQQRIAAVQHMGDGVFLVLPQGDCRIHAATHNMAAVVLSWPGGIEKDIVAFLQGLSALGILPDPVLECILDGLLLLLGQHGLLLVQYPGFILQDVIDAHIP